MRLEDSLEFDRISIHEYIKYLDKAQKIHEMGLHLDKSDIQLAKLIYYKGKTNENNID